MDFYGIYRNNAITRRIWRVLKEFWLFFWNRLFVIQIICFDFFNLNRSQNFHIEMPLLPNVPFHPKFPYLIFFKFSVELWNFFGFFSAFFKTYSRFLEFFGKYFALCMQKSQFFSLLSRKTPISIWNLHPNGGLFNRTYSINWCSQLVMLKNHVLFFLSLPHYCSVKKRVLFMKNTRWIKTAL